MCCEACCEAGSVVCEWEGIFFVLLQPEVGGNERTECGLVSLWDGDLGGLFYPFRMGFLGQDGRHRCVHDGAVDMFLHANVMAIRENQFANFGEPNRGFASRRHNHHTTTCSCHLNFTIDQFPPPQSKTVTVSTH